MQHAGLTHTYYGTAAERAVLTPTSSAALFYETDTGYIFQWQATAWRMIVPVMVAAYDYSGTSTITGWSSFTAREIICAKDGKKASIMWCLDGTSNSTLVRFTVPWTPNAAPSFCNIPCYSYDNGANTYIGLALITGGSATISVVRDIAGTWTAANRKISRGEIFFFTA